MHIGAQPVFATRAPCVATTTHLDGMRDLMKAPADRARGLTAQMRALTALRGRALSALGSAAHDACARHRTNADQAVEHRADPVEDGVNFGELGGADVALGHRDPQRGRDLARAAGGHLEVAALVAGAPQPAFAEIERDGLDASESCLASEALR